ncbi:hypothetical protein DFH09DRAFT_1366881 [Mycena vulgaris]|nr:hypothetical protein DFH09DRAFT_1366881 [Mycena vulgaris]
MTEDELVFNPAPAPSTTAHSEPEPRTFHCERLPPTFAIQDEPPTATTTSGSKVASHAPSTASHATSNASHVAASTFSHTQQHSSSNSTATNGVDTENDPVAPITPLPGARLHPARADLLGGDPCA